ncbi:MAG: response regulator [Nitrospirota bacterium]|nr:response regulator [Nitrospirota bacterium]
MPDARKQAFLKRLEEIKRNFHEQLPERVRQIERDWEVVAVGQADPALLGELYRNVHGLAGAGGSFGADGVSSAARELELVLKGLVDEDRPPTDEERDQVPPLIALLAAQALGETEGVAAFTAELTERGKRLVYLVDDDGLLAAKLAATLTSHGYEVQSFESTPDLLAACRAETPKAIVTDMVFPEGGTAGARVVDELRGKVYPMPPVVLISVRGDMEARLAAVRSGVDRYLTKPVTGRQLAAALDSLTGRTPDRPYRVLVVDDQESLASFYTEVLKGAGMEVETVTSALLGLEAVERFRPELVLTDVYMPGCTGLELAAVLRQDDRWSRMPIVFLSTEHNLDRQMAAMNLGGDEFLTKPVTPAHLVSALSARLKRARHMAHLSDDLRAALTESRQRLEAVSRHCMVVTADGDGTVTSVNRRFEAVSGRRAEALVGSPLSELFGQGFTAMWAHAGQGQTWNGEVEALPGETPFVLHATLVPHLDRTGSPHQYMLIATDVTEHRQAEAGAIQANRAKSEFLSRMSHELRTPLNAILGFSQLLEIDPEVPDGPRQAVSEITQAGSHLLDLINDVLDLSRIEAGNLNLRMGPVPLEPLLAAAITLVQPLADRYQVHIHAEPLPDPEATVRADPVRVRQVLVNLLSNAVKYNRPEGSATVRVTEASGHWRVEVIDTGQGIPKHREALLFEPFERLGAEDSAVEGTGIGLNIVRHLVGDMGGELGYESTEGQGSSFWFTLPATSPLSRQDGDQAQVAAEVAGAAPEPVETGAPRTVLYIEDNPANLRLVSELMGRRPELTLLTASQPEEGIELARTHRPALVLLDIGLPGMDGFEVLRRLRKEDATRNIPVVAVTGNAMPADRERGEQAGFDDYLVKPFRLNTFYATLNQHLNNDMPETP